VQIASAAAQVATHEDPATARLGESLYAFLPRTVLGNLRDGYAAETRRLAAKGHPLLSVHNQCAIGRHCWILTCTQHPCPAPSFFEEALA